MWSELPAFRKSRNQIIVAATFALLCALGLAVNTSVAVLNRAGWGIDFDQFYSAGRLAGTGHLYDWQALRHLERKNGIEIPTGRLPIVLYGYKIFGLLPYRIARVIWTLVSIAVILAYSKTWPAMNPVLMTAALAWSLPTTLEILYGQDIPFFLFFFAAALTFLQKSKPWCAGLLFHFVFANITSAWVFPSC